MKHTLIDGRWRGRIMPYPGVVLFWYQVREGIAERRARHTSDASTGELLAGYRAHIAPRRDSDGTY